MLDTSPADRNRVQELLDRIAELEAERDRLLIQLRGEAMYAAEKIVDHYREGISHEIGWDNLSLAQVTVEDIINSYINKAALAASEPAKENPGE